MVHANQSETDNLSVLRRQLIDLLTSNQAHRSFDDAVNNLPVTLRGVKPDELPYSIWQLVDHIRIVQWDILEFSRNPNHQSPPWPDGYWAKDAAPDEAVWQQALEQIREDRKAFITLLDNPQYNLYTPFTYGEGQNLLRESLLIADHTAYHIGEIILIRRLLNAWEG